MRISKYLNECKYTSIELLKIIFGIEIEKTGRVRLAVRLFTGISQKTNFNF
jgi:hypothetical protein